MKRLWGLILLALLIGVGIPLIQYLYKEQKAFAPDNLIRLHIVANSNSETDQAIKLKVRDCLIKNLAPELAYSNSAAESRRILAGRLSVIEMIANREISLNGGDYAAAAVMGEFNFPTRRYGELVLPHGNYQALRVVLGEGQGRNWWCVLFPPLCVSQKESVKAKDPPEMYIAKLLKQANKKKAAWNKSR